MSSPLLSSSVAASQTRLDIAVGIVSANELRSERCRSLNFNKYQHSDQVLSHPSRALAIIVGPTQAS